MTYRAELMADLVKAQNHPANIRIDIMTIAGLMSDAELEAHVSHYQEQAFIYDARQRGFSRVIIHSDGATRAVTL